MEGMDSETLKTIEDRIERLEATLGLINPNEQTGESIVLNVLESYEKSFGEKKDAKETMKDLQKKLKELDPFIHAPLSIGNTFEGYETKVQKIMMNLALVEDFLRRGKELQELKGVVDLPPIFASAEVTEKLKQLEFAFGENILRQAAQEEELNELLQAYQLLIKDINIRVLSIRLAKNIPV